MASRGRKPQGARRKSMWTDNPNFDPHWDQLWWGRKSTDVTLALHPPVPAHSGKPPPFDEGRPPINPYDYTPYEWPAHAIDHTTKTDYALQAARKPAKPTDTRTYAAPILKETTRPEKEKSYTKPMGLSTHVGEKAYTTASKFTTRSVPEPGVKELTPHVFGHPEALGAPNPKPDNVLQSRTVTTSPKPASPPCAASPPACPSKKPDSPCPSSNPNSPPASSCASSKPASPPACSKTASPPPSSKPDSSCASSKPASPTACSKPTSPPTSSKPDSSCASSKPDSSCASSKPDSSCASSKPASPPASSKPETSCASSKPASPPASSKPASPPTSSKPDTSCASSKPASPPAPAPAPGGGRPDQFDINPSTYKSAWGGAHKDKERKQPWPKAYEKSREFAHHKTDITKGVMVFEAV